MQFRKEWQHEIRHAFIVNSIPTSPEEDAMYPRNSLSNSTHPPSSGRSRSAVTVVSNGKDHLSFGISLSRKIDNQRNLKVAICKTCVDGYFSQIDFAHAMPHRLSAHSVGAADDDESRRIGVSLASFVSLLSVSIRANAFVRRMRLGLLTVEAVMESDAHQISADGKSIRKAGMVKVTIDLDADAPRSTIEAMIADVAKWSLGPTVTEFADRFEISLRQ
jgi:hypothetical protein